MVMQICQAGNIVARTLAKAQKWPKMSKKSIEAQKNQYIFLFKVVRAEKLLLHQKIRFRNIFGRNRGTS